MYYALVDLSLQHAHADRDDDLRQGWQIEYSFFGTAQEVRLYQLLNPVDQAQRNTSLERGHILIDKLWSERIVFLVQLS